MNKKLITMIFILAFVGLAFSSVYATTDTIGNCANTDNQNHVRPLYTQLTASSSGTLQTIGANIPSGDSGSFAVAIYSDNSGTPNTLLGNSIVNSLETGWNDLPIPQTVTITSSTNYWLAFEITIGQSWCWGGSGNNQIDGNTYDGQLGTFPTTATNGGTFSEVVNMRMTYASSTTTSTSTSTTSTSTSSTTTSTSTTTTSTSTSTSVTTTSVSSTSTIPTTTINGLGLNQTGLASVFVLGFNVIPQFGAGLVLLAFGITFTRAKKLAPALLIAGLIAFLITDISAANITIAVFVTALFVVVFIYELFKAK